MKISIIFILLLSLLLQSCYSYRVIDKNNNFIANKKYKIKLTNKYQKVIILSSTDSTITVVDNKNIESTIVKNDIKTIKKRYFSVSKTVLFPIGVGITSLGVALIISPPNFYNPR
jgi:hypothetical protein